MLDERFNLSQQDIKVLKYAYESLLYDLKYYPEDSPKDQGWRTMYWLTYSEAPDHDGKRLYEIGLFEWEYSKEAKIDFFRITSNGIEVLKVLGYTPDNLNK